MPVQMQVRRGTAAAWTSANPTMLAGEIGYETDTGKFKVGDGVTAWTGLAYSNPGPAGPPGASANIVLLGLDGNDGEEGQMGPQGPPGNSIAIPVTVPNGGTGLSTLTTAYGLVAAGTTATGALQNVGVGTSGYTLKSGGSAA